MSFDAAESRSLEEPRQKPVYLTEKYPIKTPCRCEMDKCKKPAVYKVGIDLDYGGYGTLTYWNLCEDHEGDAIRLAIRLAEGE